MKTSQFNVLITPEEHPNLSILYNTFHDHKLIIENDDIHIETFFEKIKTNQSLSEKEEEIAQTFLELGLLLEDDVDEKQLFDEWYINKIQNVESRLSLLVITTMACNLRCPYCYEQEQLDNTKFMSKETADQLIDWVKKQIRSKPIEELDVIYYGGEPLMNKNVIYHMSSSFQEYAKTYGFNYIAGMISNGVLLKKSVADKLRHVGLNWVKITLDGVQVSHDKTRITASGKGSFDVIIKNLEQLNENLKPDEKPIAIKIGGNFREDTYEGFLPLAKFLAESKFAPYLDYINLKPVQDVSMVVEDTGSANPCDVNSFNEENTERMVRLRAELAKYNLPANDGLNLGPCDFYRGDSYAIGMDGHLYPCIAYVDNKWASIGHVGQEMPKVSQLKVHQRWLETQPWTEDCYNCSFLPVCTGGCRATATANGHTWEATVCEKEYFQRMSKAIAKEMIKSEIDQSTPSALHLAPSESSLPNLASLQSTQVFMNSTDFQNQQHSLPQEFTV